VAVTFWRDLGKPRNTSERIARYAKRDLAQSFGPESTKLLR